MNMHQTNMNLRKLMDKELETSFHSAVKNERNIIHLVILHVQEVSRRKLFLARGYGSLFSYLTKEMKYSASAAQRRIEAARLMSEVPGVAAKLQSGELNLSQIGDIQNAVKQAEKVHQERIGADVKAALVNEVLNESTSKTQQICAEALDIPVLEPQRIKTQRDESRRVEVTFTKEQFAKFEKARDLLAHKNFQNKNTQNMNDVLETMFDEILSKTTKPNEKQSAGIEKIALRTSKSKSAKENGGNTFSEDDATAVQISETSSVRTSEAVTVCGTEAEIRWQSLTPKRKRSILEEEGCCQYIDYESGRMCGSTFNLHIDHIIPKHAGGKNLAGNLRVLCREHNLYREQASKRYLEI